MGKKCLCKSSSNIILKVNLWEKLLNTLNKNKIKLNITAVYTAKQTKKILKNINKKTKVIISIFAGRMADAGKDPIPQFKKYQNFKKI